MAKTHAWNGLSDPSNDYNTLFAKISDNDFDTPVLAAPDSSPSDVSTIAPSTSASPPPPTQVLYATESGESSAINVADINQGQIGDCFLLASIGAMVLQNPSSISNMIHTNANGTESINLYESINGRLPGFNTKSFQQVTETIKTVFPTFSVNGGATQDMVNGQKEIWPQVLEKAVQKLDGGWAAISNGGNPVIAMEELTGHSATFMAPASVTLATLQNFVTAGDLVVMDTPSSGSLPNGLVADHAYMFNGVTGTGAGAVVNLLNPWGFNQPAPILVSQLSSGFTEVDVGHLA